MKKTSLYLILVLTMLCCLVNMAQAHPPSDVTLKFDKRTHILTVTALHNTQNPSTHYIRLIEVTLNGVPMISQNFSSQTDKTRQVAQYTMLDVKPGATLAAKATCNLRGSLEKKLKVK